MVTARSISSLFADGLPRDDPVAFVGGKPISFAKFKGDVAALSAAFKEKPGGRWLLLSADAYAVAVGLLAAFHTSRTIILPANFQMGHIGELSRKVDGVLVEGRTAPLSVRSLNVFGHQTPRASVRLEAFDSDRAEVFLHTAGTTGNPELVVKSIRCLDAEVAVIAATFPRIPSTIVRATVPAHHLYGLMFRLLLPLSMGEPFSSETLQYPEELERLCRSDNKIRLISSPAFLRRASLVLDMDVIKDRIIELFSSGGPLSAETATTFSVGLAKPVVEIYGSTETGAIGYRVWQGTGEPEPLMPFAGVELTADPDSSVLIVESPFICNMPPHRTGDRVRFSSDGRFVLLGRADRIVKIEEQRVSLNEVENLLSSQTKVADAQVEVLEGRTGRKFLGAAVVLKAEGWSALKESGKRMFSRELRAGLAPYLDLAVLPRKWRFVKRLPQTVKGTPSLIQFRALFGETNNVITSPKILERASEPSGLNLKLKLPAELKYFDGHFDGQPILAGVVLIAWAANFARNDLVADRVFQRMEALKFFRILTPEDEVTLTLSFSKDKGAIQFRYESDGTTNASGRIRFSVVA